MKPVGIAGRILLSILCSLSFAACTDVSFAPTPGSSVVLESGAALTDEFTQGYVTNKIDILFVVDNSGSMAEEQQRLGERISSFIDTLYDVDWQIGITTTDVSNGPYGLQGSLLPLEGAPGSIITPKTPNALEVFKRTVVREETFNCSGSCPSGDEQPLRAAIMAIEKRDTVNRGFFRDGADIGLLVLSDEDERSDGKNGATTPEEVLKAVKDAFQDTKRLLTYGMIVVPGDTQCLNAERDHHYGTFVAALAELTGGLVGSLCEPDYAPTLGVLGDNARQLLEYVQLRATPDESTVRVTFTPHHETNYRVVGRRVYFEVPPSKGTRIRIDYVVQ